MYADLEKIEARGKRKKDKSKGLFSSFGKKDEPEPEVTDQTPEPPKPQEKIEQAAPPPMEKPAPKPAPQPQMQAVKPAPIVTVHKPVETIQVAPAEKPAHLVNTAQPTATAKSSWTPLTGSRLSQAEEELLNYKKWLNKGYKSGVLTKEQCNTMVREKEMELHLRPPEN